MKKLEELLKSGIVLYDGSKGVELQRRGAEGLAEEWNLTNEQGVLELYAAYIEAGAKLIQTNTFSANRAILSRHGLGEKTGEIIKAGVRLALRAAEGSGVLAAVSAGPTGRFLEPAGDMSFSECYDIFKEVALSAREAGAAYIHFETFTDLSELRAAILAAKENTDMGIIATASFEGEATMSGNTPEAVMIVLSSLGVLAAGANCAGGPETLLAPIERMGKVSDTPLAVKPNAGLPEMVKGKTVFRMGPEEFAACAPAFSELGVRLIGGCCGTGSEHIKKLGEALLGLSPRERGGAKRAYLSSAYGFSEIKESVLFHTISEEEKRALAEGDFFPLFDALAEGEGEILAIDFRDALFDAWGFMQQFSLYVRKPVIFRFERDELLEECLRYYPGRAGVQAGNDRQKKTAKKYGAYIIKSYDD